jgi:hypothetical protein
VQHFFSNINKTENGESGFPEHSPSFIEISNLVTKFKHSNSSINLPLIINMDSSSDEIKSLAINGLFDDVDAKFGKKKVAKAVNYVEVKLQALLDKKKTGQSLEHILYATPFMLFALDKDWKQVRYFNDTPRFFSYFHLLCRSWK